MFTKARLEALWSFAIGIFLILLAFYLFEELSLLEEAGGRRRAAWPVALLYNLFGKTVTSGVFGLGGILLCGISVMDFINNTSNDDDDDNDDDSEEAADDDKK